VRTEEVEHQEADDVGAAGDHAQHDRQRTKTERSRRRRPRRDGSRRYRGTIRRPRRRRSRRWLLSDIPRQKRLPFNYVPSDSMRIRWAVQQDAPLVFRVVPVVPYAA
jgi:hypothetical protein